MDMKNYLRTQITLYEDRRQERRSKYAVQLASWQLRSNSPKTFVSGQGFRNFLKSYWLNRPVLQIGRHQAAGREPAGSYDKTTRTAICFEHKTQYL